MVPKYMKGAGKKKGASNSKPNHQEQVTDGVEKKGNHQHIYTHGMKAVIGTVFC
jgi:hypothetical protein